MLAGAITAKVATQSAQSGTLACGPLSRLCSDEIIDAASIHMSAMSAPFSSTSSHPLPCADVMMMMRRGLSSQPSTASRFSSYLIEASRSSINIEGPGRQLLMNRTSRHAARKRPTWLSQPWLCPSALHSNQVMRLGLWRRGDPIVCLLCCTPRAARCLKIMPTAVALQLAPSSRSANSRSIL